MLVELDTVLVGMYTLVDDLYVAHIAPAKPVRCGHAPEVSDSEVLTLVLSQHWTGLSERQFVRTVNDHLTQTCHLAYPRARSRWGLLTRVAAKLAACNLGMWLNRILGRPACALAILFSG